ncbi:hypothetical protein AB0G95_21755 [Streptomyces virginiae]|uniref:hypothetical protein n=1 Tax=Streptomyces virginiae TaxID=1961 RepID=UPI003428ED0E
MIHSDERRKGAPHLGATGPGEIGPFGPWDTGDTDGADDQPDALGPVVELVGLVRRAAGLARDESLGRRIRWRRRRKQCARTVMVLAELAARGEPLLPGVTDRLSQARATMRTIRTR